MRDYFVRWYRSVSRKLQRLNKMKFMFIDGPLLCCSLPSFVFYLTSESTKCILFLASDLFCTHLLERNQKLKKKKNETIFQKLIKMTQIAQIVMIYKERTRKQNTFICFFIRQEGFKMDLLASNLEL